MKVTDLSRVCVCVLYRNGHSLLLILSVEMNPSKCGAVACPQFAVVAYEPF